MCRGLGWVDLIGFCCRERTWSPSGTQHLPGWIRVCLSPQEICSSLKICAIRSFSLLKNFQRLLAAKRSSSHYRWASEVPHHLLCNISQPSPVQFFLTDPGPSHWFLKMLVGSFSTPLLKMVLWQKLPIDFKMASTRARTWNKLGL